MHIISFPTGPDQVKLLFINLILELPFQHECYLLSEKAFPLHLFHSDTDCIPVLKNKDTIETTDT